MSLKSFLGASLSVFLITDAYILLWYVHDFCCQLLNINSFEIWFTHSLRTVQGGDSKALFYVRSPRKIPHNKDISSESQNWMRSPLHSKNWISETEYHRNSVLCGSCLHTKSPTRRKANLIKLSLLKYCHYRTALLSVSPFSRMSTTT